jgi:hypothetical protein
LHLPSSDALAARGSTLWSRFRRWPWWAQALLWLVTPIPVLLLACSKPRDERPHWVGLTLAVTVLWIGSGVASAHVDKTQEAAGATTTTTSTTETHQSSEASTTTLPVAPEGVSRSGNGQDLAAGSAASDSFDRATSTDALLATLAAIPVQAEDPRAGYNRDLFPHWDDEDHDGCDTRCEVLTAQRRSDGTWLSEWDGYTTNVPGELQVDHVVALAEAWDSGANHWTAAQRDEFADYLPNLLAVTATENLRKSDRDASEWFPSRAEANCVWSSTVVRVKAHWSLTVDQAEHDALANLLRSCPDFVAPTTTTAPTPTTVAPAAPKPTAPATAQPAPEPDPTPSNGSVTPGAFCAPQGATGTTSTGLPMTCAGAKCDGTAYTQPRWRKTNC